mgnify:CR=1 FL=1
MSEISKIFVNGITYDLQDTSAVHNITVTQTLTSGTELGKITVDGITTTLYSTTDTNTDTKVTQTATATNATYPLLFTGTASQTSTSTNTSRFGTLIHANPGTGRVSMKALVVGQSTTANYSGWTTTVPSSTTNAVTGQVMFVVES